MHWSAAYIGLPWQERGLTREGVACWGLVRLVLAEVQGLDVPDYAASVPSLQARAEVAAVFEGGVEAGPWIKVEPADAREFDVLVFRRAGLEAHAGLVCGPGRMLHISSGRDSHVADYTAGRWAPRLAGVYRHRALAEAVERALVVAASVTGCPPVAMAAQQVTIQNRTAARVHIGEVPDGRGGRRIEVIVGRA